MGNDYFSRPRLIERLNEGLHRKLTLISAPAGFGKTTLVSEWAHVVGARQADLCGREPTIMIGRGAACRALFNAPPAIR